MGKPDYVKLAIKIADKVFKVVKKEFLNEGKKAKEKNNGKSIERSS